MKLAKTIRLDVSDTHVFDHPPGTLLAMERAISGQNITETTRVLTAADEPAPAKIWTIVEDD